MLTDAELQSALEASPAPRVTKDAIESRITHVEFNLLGGTTLTHCTLHLDNGFQATGESACVDPANFDEAIGRRVAYDQAFAKLWPLFGFLLAERRFLGNQMIGQEKLDYNNATAQQTLGGAS